MSPSSSAVLPHNIRTGGTHTKLRSRAQKIGLEAVSEGNVSLTCELRILFDRQDAQYSPLVCHPGGTPQNSLNMGKKRFSPLTISISKFQR